jgi:dTDP-4-dehydrorhamnose 3,5-epimerase
MINRSNSKINGVIKIRYKKFNDRRGYFYEIYNKKEFKFSKPLTNFVQSNISLSNKNVLRGLHFQSKNPQSQLVSVISGKIFDVVVDLRMSSKTFMQYDTFTLSEKSNLQIFMPPGIAHGFVVLSEKAIVNYEVNKTYEKKNECGLIWNDQTLKIKWPITKPIISKRDRAYNSFKELLKKNKLPK